MRHVVSDISDSACCSVESGHPCRIQRLCNASWSCTFERIGDCVVVCVWAVAACKGCKLVLDSVSLDWVDLINSCDCGQLVKYNGKVFGLVFVSCRQVVENFSFQHKGVRTGCSDQEMVDEDYPWNIKFDPSRCWSSTVNLQERILYWIKTHVSAGTWVQSPQRDGLADIRCVAYRENHTCWSRGDYIDQIDFKVRITRRALGVAKRSFNRKVILSSVSWEVCCNPDESRRRNRSPRWCSCRCSWWQNCFNCICECVGRRKTRRTICKCIEVKVLVVGSWLDNVVLVSNGGGID